MRCDRDALSLETNDPNHHPAWFHPAHGVEKWLDLKSKILGADPDHL